MSGSPKYSRFSLSDEAARRVREENRRREAERAAQRAAEAERLRKERLRQGQVTFGVRLAEEANGLAALAETPAGRHVAGTLRQLQARLAEFKQKPPTTENELKHAGKGLDRARREIKQAMAQGKAAEDARGRKQGAAMVLKWKYRAAEDRLGSKQFDSDGLRRFEAAVRKVEEHLAGGDLAVVQNAMTTVGQIFEEHRSEVEKQRDLYAARQHAAEDAAARLQDGVVGLEADSAVQRWEAPAVVAIAARANQVGEIIKTGRFEHAAREAGKLLAECQQILKRAEERQCRQVQDDYIAESTIAALQECGFTLDGISPSPHGNGAKITIQVHDEQSRGLDVTVSPDRRIEWDPHGFARQLVAGSQGQPATICDVAVEAIEEVQDRLNTNYGVETGELTWNGKDPSLPSRSTQSRARRAVRNSQRTRRTHEARLE